MKKRIISFVLAVATVCAMLPYMPQTADAAMRGSYAPYPLIEYDYSSTVTCGTVRYMSQNPDSQYFNWNYWPASAFGWYSSPKSECGTACISMALSYISINKTPKEMLEAYNGQTMFIGWGGSTHSSLGTSSAAVSDAVDNYINGNGKYSPPVIRIEPFSSTSSQHYVVLLGKISTDQYLVLDPYKDSAWTVTISGSSATYYNGTNPITQVHQWYNANASTEDNYANDYRAWSQSDSRWGSLPLGTGSYTVSSSGCLVTAVTKLIIQSGFKDQNSFDVATLVNWLNSNNGFTSSGGLYWDNPSTYVSEFVNCGDIVSYGSYSSTGNNELLLKYINQGYHLLIQVNDGGHWIAVDEAKSAATGEIYIMDSLSGVANADITLTSRYSIFNAVHAYKGKTTPEEASRPGKPVLNVAINDSNVAFTWNPTENTTHYNLWLNKMNDAGEWERIEQIFYAESGVSRTFEPGDYLAQLLSYNSNA